MLSLGMSQLLMVPYTEKISLMCSSLTLRVSFPTWILVGRGGGEGVRLRRLGDGDFDLAFAGSFLMVSFFASLSLAALAPLASPFASPLAFPDREEEEEEDRDEEEPEELDELEDLDPFEESLEELLPDPLLVRFFFFSAASAGFSAALVRSLLLRLDAMLFLSF